MSTRLEIQRFSAAIRVGTPVACGPDKAIDSARACIAANEAIKQKTRVVTDTRTAIEGNQSPNSRGSHSEIAGT